MDGGRSVSLAPSGRRLTPYLSRMAWIMRKKRLGDLNPGDRLIDENGQATTIQSKTDAKIPEELYELSLQTGDGDRLTVRADGEHLWPLDPGKPGRVPPEWEGAPEADSKTISEWTAQGWQPALAPLAKSDGNLVSWTVRSCAMLSPETAASTKVQCVGVDSPTHTFLVAGADETEYGASAADQPAALPAELSEDAPEVMLVDRGTFDEILRQSAPTHNCGGPLTLDTPLLLADGGTVTMGDVKPGDKLVSASGRETTVLSVSPVMRPEKLYSLSFEAVVDEDLPEWTPEEIAALDDEAKTAAAKNSLQAAEGDQC